MSVKIGDVVEVNTEKGYAYCLYTHKHKQYGALLRVWSRQYAEPLTHFDALVREPPTFSCFFPLGAAVKRQLVRVVGRVAVPSELEPFPIFRSGMVDPATRKVAVWWLWDGTKEWRIGSLEPAQRALPISEVWNDTALRQRIESGWTPETDAST
jgi:hypothetical protein